MSDSGFGSGPGSESGSTPPGTPDVQVFISGGANGQINGLHPNEQGPPDPVIQGMQWSGGLMLQGTDAGNYQIVNSTWSFPSGALKGYGTFTKQYENGDPARSWVQFTGSPTAASGNEVRADANFSGDDLNSDLSEADDHVISTFYWGPMSSGSSQVSVTATVKNVITGSTISGLTDSVEFNVLQPTGEMSLISIGIPGVTPPQEYGPQYLSMAKNTPRDAEGHANGTPLGIRYSSSVTAPGGFGGVFMHNQTMTTFEQRRYHDATRFYREARGKYNGQPYDLSSNFVLDTRVGYLGRVDDPRVGPGASPNVSSAPVGHTFYSNDSPSSPLVLPADSTGIYWTRADSFKINLMYNPLATDPNAPPAGPPSSIWVPVGVLPWYWGVSALVRGGIWVDDPHPDNPPDSGTHGNYQASTLYPTWSVNVNDANGNNDKTVSPWVSLP